MNVNVLAKISRDFPLYLDSDATKELETWEEWITFYLHLSEASNAFSWHKADFLLQLYKKFRGESLEKFASDVGEPRSTVVNYVRTSKAFPPDTRVPHLSFTHHFKCSFVDSYDERKKIFATKKRFKVIENAGNRNVSTRQLQDEILKSKERSREVVATCDLCKRETEKYQKYVFFAPGTGEEADKYTLHKKCYSKIRNFIEKY